MSFPSETTPIPMTDALDEQLRSWLRRNDPSCHDHYAPTLRLLARTIPHGRGTMWGSGILSRPDPGGDIVVVLRGPFAGTYRSRTHVPRDYAYYAEQRVSFPLRRKVASALAEMYGPPNDVTCWGPN
jgi:hypothetical protein